MPYFEKGITVIDAKGVKVDAGDVLERTDLNPSNEPWRYFGAKTEIYHDVSDPHLAIRDFNAHNICMMVDVEYKENIAVLTNLVTLGPWQRNLKILEEEQITSDWFQD